MNNSRKRLYILTGIILITLCIMYSYGGVSAPAADFSNYNVSRTSPFSDRSLWLLRQIRLIIENYQVDAGNKSLSEDDLLHGAAKGMVEAWKDPYTRFVTPQRLKDEEIDLEGKYGGLGMYIGDRDGQILVIISDKSDGGLAG